MDTRYLAQQRQTWYLRLRVPVDLRPQIGKGEIVETLGTRDIRAAQTRRWPRVAHWQSHFQALRGRAGGVPHGSQRAEFEEALAGWQASVGEQPESYPIQEAVLDWLHDHEHEQDTPAWQAAQAFWHSLRPSPEHVQWQPAVKPPVPARYRQPFSELASLYLAERQRDPGAKLTGQTAAQIEAVFRLFADFTGDQPLDLATKATAGQFLDQVAQLDPLWGRSPRTKRLTISELPRATGGQGLSNRTLNRYSSSLAGLWKWAASRGCLSDTSEEPFAGQFRKIASHRRTGWLPFTDPEVCDLLAAAAAEPRDRAMHWVPLIGAYSGMRSNEICSLRTSDVRQLEGVWFFDVTGAKTEAGDRRVPVHSAVLEAGLLGYLEGLPEGGPLWPSLKPGGPDGKLNWYFTRQFGAFRQRLGIDRERLGFHSFRKAFATKLEQARVPESEAVQVLGHEKLSMSYRVYSLGVDLRRLRQIVEVVGYSMGSQHARQR